jgi:hypothetical protein
MDDRGDSSSDDESVANVPLVLKIRKSQQVDTITSDGAPPKKIKNVKRTWEEAHYTALIDSVIHRKANINNRCDECSKSKNGIGATS